MGIYAYKCATCGYPTGDTQTWTSGDGHTKGSVVRFECYDGRELFVRGSYDGGGCITCPSEGAEGASFDVIDAQFQSQHWVTSLTRANALISRGVYCDGVIEHYFDDSDEEEEPEHHHCAPAGATLLDAVPRDAVPFLPTMPPIARLFEALGAPSPRAALRDGATSSVPDASRVRAILDAHPRMDLSERYSFFFGPNANFLSFALEKDDPEIVFALVSSGRVDVSNFRACYDDTYGRFKERGNHSRFDGSTFDVRTRLREESVAVRFVHDVEERGSCFKRWRADVRRVFAGLRFLLEKGRITKIAPIEAARPTRSAARSKPATALVPLLSAGDDVLRLVLDYAIDASSTCLLPTKAGCVVNHANSARPHANRRPARKK